MNPSLIITLATLAFAFLLTVLILRRLIPYLKGKKMGQHILEIGPRWHKNKEGTPTMGGLSFLITALICGIVLSVYIGVRVDGRTMAGFISTLAFGLECGLIGIVDDIAKFTKKENEGLTPIQKYALQLAAAVLYIFLLARFDYVGTEIPIPFAGVSLNLGFFTYIIWAILITGIVNSVNLTDGIDGLASSVTLVVGVFFLLVAAVKGTAQWELGTVSAIIIGCTGAFLVYNFYPARVFMGDTGSLFLGALVVGCAFLAGCPLIIVLAGIIYIAESGSVILQVGYFKLTHGKRLFLMSPIHHHFEKKGWSEIKVVTVFSIITALACAGAWFGL